MAKNTRVYTQECSKGSQVDFKGCWVNTLGRPGRVRHLAVSGHARVGTWVYTRGRHPGAKPGCFGHTRVDTRVYVECKVVWAYPGIEVYPR